MKSTLAAESIPYENEKDRFKLIKELLESNRSVEVWEDEKVIYSFVNKKKRNNKMKHKGIY